MFAAQTAARRRLNSRSADCRGLPASPRSMLNWNASGSPASVCRMTGRAGRACGPLRRSARSDASAASIVCLAASSSPSGAASFSMRLSDASSTKSTGFRFSASPFRSSQGSGSSYSADRDLRAGTPKRIAVPISASVEMRGGAGRQDQQAASAPGPACALRLRNRLAPMSGWCGLFGRADASSASPQPACASGVQDMQRLQRLSRQRRDLVAHPAGQGAAARAMLPAAVSSAAGPRRSSRSLRVFLDQIDELAYRM